MYMIVRVLYNKPLPLSRFFIIYSYAFASFCDDRAAIASASVVFEFTENSLAPYWYSRE